MAASRSPTGGVSLAAAGRQAVSWVPCRDAGAPASPVPSCRAESAPDGTGKNHSAPATCPWTAPGPAPPCLSPGPPGPGWAVRANSRHSIHDPALPVSKCAAAAQEWRLISPPGGTVTRCQLCAPRTVRWGLTGISSEAWSPPSPQCAPSRHPHSTSPPGKFRGCRVVGGGHAQVQREASPVLETRAGLGGG